MTTTALFRAPRLARAWVFALLLVALGSARAEADDAALLAEVRGLVREARLDGARVGVSIRDLKTGEILAAVNDRERFIPASNMKLLTTGAALSVLGPDFQFRTEVLVRGESLVLRGSGDPTLGDPEYLDEITPRRNVEELLAALADAVATGGVAGVREVVVDDRIFDRQWVHPDWPADQLDRHYCTGVAGLNFHRNIIDFFASPNPAGEGAPSFQTQPVAPWIASDVRVSAKTVRSGKNTFWVRRDEQVDRFTLMGDVRFATEAPERRALHDAPSFAGRLLADRLRQAGVRVGSGDVQRVARLAAEGEDLSGGRVLAAVTTPVRDVTLLCNRDSVNLYAEALLKRMGREISGERGSWASGAAVLRMVLGERLGPDAAGEVTVSDGSGMSRANQVSPRVMTAWLESIYEDERVGPAFVESLATPGSGTLERRFREVRVQNHVAAKSGLLNGVRTLSGYVTEPATGRTLAFSVLVNDLPLSGEAPQRALRLHERIVAAADRWLSAETAPARAAVGE
ncbi:MAG: D-alanyl-D-alanine carboxypeptidase/D-alanyl-D-alanine-endopeptidase [Phycisphaerales bacterium]|nr:D-alanyl-D-alanine carboxypeptidase/D-alanyl-D-alanine-endopeptidase [Phycisphaerales bacterium]